MLEKLVAEAKAREIQFEEAIENLNGDLRNAEGEVGRWRKVVKEGKGGVVQEREVPLGPGVEEVRLAEEVETLRSAMEYLRLENSRIQLRGVVDDTWLNEPLFSAKEVDDGETRRAKLVADFRKFMAGVRFIDVKVVQIGGYGWKSNKTTARYVLRRQQEEYRRLCSRKENL